LEGLFETLNQFICHIAKHKQRSHSGVEA